MVPSNSNSNAYTRGMGSLIFFSRWMQAPLYLGLIVVQGIYVYHFFAELWHLLAGLLPGSAAAVAAATIGPDGKPVAEYSMETQIMLKVLGLIDVVMIANLLVMVIIGGYETFVSRLNLRGHPDQLEWLSQVNANILKVKLATALIGISSIHLLRTFISAEHMTSTAIFWQVTIHLTFVLSAVALAYIDRLISHHHAAVAKG